MSELTYRLLITMLCIFCHAVHSLEDSWFQIDDEDAILSIPDLIIKYGYQVESHTVTTEDGYGLTMFRILPLQPFKKAKLPVIMGHGLLGNAADFVIIGPNNSLAYLLADNGYDVWLSNARGSRYSRKHSTFPLDSEDYWDFSWHEIGYYDLPAMIDYILELTGVNKLHYVGFSLGTTTYFVLTSTRPEYNDKIALMVAFAPTAFVKQVRSPVAHWIIQTVERFKKFMNSHYVYGLLPHADIYHVLAKILCVPSDPECFCFKFYAQIVGPHPEAFDAKVMTTFTGHIPAGASFNQVIHYVQIERSGLFRQYDYGREGNIRKYGANEPPVYKLELSTAPIALYYGLNDWLVHPQNVQTLAKLLPAVVVAKPVADKKFNHIDFLLGKNVRSLVYDQVVELMDRFN